MRAKVAASFSFCIAHPGSFRSGFVCLRLEQTVATAWGLNAFSIDWNNHRAYLFQLFSLMGRCLKKIRDEKADVIRTYLACFMTWQKFHHLRNPFRQVQRASFTFISDKQQPPPPWSPRPVGSCMEPPQISRSIGKSVEHHTEWRNNGGGRNTTYNDRNLR